MGSRDKKRIRVRASKRRLNSSSRHSSLLAAHSSSNHHSHGRGDIILQDLGIGSSRSSTRRSERILNQSLAAERAARQRRNAKLNERRENYKDSMKVIQAEDLSQ